MRRLILATMLISLCLFVAPPPATAFNAFPAGSGKGGNDGVCLGAEANSTVCATASQQAAKGDDPTIDLIVNITNIVAIFAGSVAVIVIIVGALRFATSGSDVSTNSRTDTDIEKARGAIVGALIGLVIVVLARTIIVFVLRKIN